MKKILVLGATGRQGGAVARTLAAHGHEVTALVRSPESPAAHALGALGVRLVEGDLGDPRALGSAAGGQDAVFGLSIPFGPGGKDEEVRAGLLLADIATETHLVFSSVRGADRLDPSEVDHAGAKQIIEAGLRERAPATTVIGPVYFMDNALTARFGDLGNGVLATPLSPGKRLDQVAVADIAAMAVLALENPETMAGRRVDIASDSVTGVEAAAILSDTLGRTIRYEQTPIESVRRFSGDLAAMWEAFEDNDDYLDIAALHAGYPEIAWHSYAAWAAEADWGAAAAEAGPRAAG